jgi:hypothetical protein
VEFAIVPFDSDVRLYEKQAAALLAALQAGDARAFEFFRHKLPRFLDEKITWLPLNVSDEEIRAAQLGIEDARLALARGYDLQDWGALASYAEAASSVGSEVHQFEAAVEAVIGGDLGTLGSLLTRNPELIRARSTRICCFDPPVHRATLLHYIGANGVEGYRQKTPPNAVEIARTLLSAGAEVDALADMYGGRCTTMSMLVSSSPPAESGLQVPLIETLLDFGASPEPSGEGAWTSPLITALTFGFLDAALTLVNRGARVDGIEAAAGLGRVDEVKRGLPDANTESRHRAFALAAQLGHAEVVEVLLDAGEDPDRYNPERLHSHATAMHQAVWNGHLTVVRLLVNRGARLDLKDRLYHSTPLGWAEHGGRSEIVNYLKSCGASG